MARKRRSSKRDNTSIASSLLRSPTVSLLSEIEDRRQFHPLADVRPAKGRSKLSTVVGIAPVGGDRKVSRRSKSRGDKFQFSIPNSVAICVRRKQRREALFALGRTGKGARSRKRRNYYSDVACR